MKVVVTGGSGQLGALVLTRLLANRKIKRIVSLDLVPPPVAGAKLDWKIADLTDPGLDRHLEGADALLHFAFVVAKRMPRERMRAVNVEGSRRMFEHAAARGVKTIVYSSSMSAYGDQPDRREPFSEDSPRTRWTALPYADDKFEVEAFLDQFEPAHPEIRLVRLRPAILVGRRINHELARSLSSRVLVAVTPAPMPLVWDEDVADAAMSALLGEARGAFNLTADEQLSAQELARLTGFRLIRLPKRVLSVLSPVMERLADTDASWFRAADVCLPASSEKAKRELSWNPRCKTVSEVLRHFDAVTPRRLDRRLALYFRLIDLVGRRAPADLPEEARRLNLEIHLDLTGPRGGDFRWKLEAGTVRLGPGMPRPPDATLTLSPDTLLALLVGDDDVSSARMAGRLRVTGEPQAGLVFAGLITYFKNAVQKPGVDGAVARGFSRWFSSGLGHKEQAS